LINYLIMYSLPIAAHANASSGPATMGSAGELSVWEGSSESGGTKPRREEHTASTETARGRAKGLREGYFGHLRWPDPHIRASKW